jgi:hypothetical protein
MKKMFFVTLCMLFLIISCADKKGTQTKNSPLATVVKLQTAEYLMDYTEAKNYIDVNSVYGDKNLPDSLSPEKAWMEMVSFMSNMTDKKFTRQFKYYDYDVIESVNRNKAEVFFKPKNNANKGITYKLELRNDAWIVYEIDYKTKINTKEATK